jgi:hypothetical protein
MASDAKFDVFSILLADLDHLYATLRESCADLESIEQPTITPLSQAVQGIHQYKIQIENLRRAEESVLGLRSITVNGER